MAHKGQSRLENVYKNVKLEIMYTNIDGLVSKLNELKDYMLEEKTQLEQAILDGNTYLLWNLQPID